MKLRIGVSYITKSQFPRNPTSMHRLVTISLWKSVDSWLQIDFLFIYHFHCSFPSLRTIVISTSTDYSSNPALHLRFQLWSIFSSHVELMQSYIIKYWTLKMKIKKYKKFAENAERRSAQRQLRSCMRSKYLYEWKPLSSALEWNIFLILATELQSFRLSFGCHIVDWYPFFMILYLHYMDFNTFRGKGADSLFCTVDRNILEGWKSIIHANAVPDSSTWWNPSHFSSSSRTPMTQILTVHPTAILKLAYYTVWTSMMRFETKPMEWATASGVFFFSPSTHRIFISKATQTLAHECMYRHTRWPIFIHNFLLKGW